MTEMSQNKTVIVKVGGSLLSLSDLPRRLQRLRNTIESENVVFVAGGGELVDVIRRWDDTHGLNPDVSHELAIETLKLSARLLAGILPDAKLCAELPETQPTADSVVLDVPVILAKFHSRGEAPLPAGWHVTSDSIAAWIAVHWPAEELILAKSTGGPMRDGIAPKTSPDGFVDPWLQTLVPQLPVVSWCNLRGDPDQRFLLQV